MITKKELRNMATAQSFSRGEDYFGSDSVRKLKRISEYKFTAKVRGSESYDVSLDLSHDNIDFDCDCPYDYDGICKHCVAMGLAVIEAFGDKPFANTSTTSFVDLPKNSLPFTQVFQESTTEVKLEFLSQLLLKDTSLQHAFKQYAAVKIPDKAIQANPPTKQQGKNEVIDNLSTEIFEALSDLAFDDENLMAYGDYEDDEFYYSEDSFEEPATAMISEVLENHASKIGHLVEEGRLLEAFNIWLGVYEGIIAATEPAEEDYSIWDSYPAFNIEIWHSLLTEKKAFEYLDKRPFASQESQQVVDLLIERYQITEKVSEKSEVFYQLSDFEKPLITLSNQLEVATYIRRQFEKHQLIDKGIARLMVHIAKVLNDTPYWLKIAEQFANFDLNIATELLEYYAKEQKKTAFISIASKVYEVFNNQVDRLILDTISHQDSPDFYKKVSWHYALRKQNIKYYEQLKPILTAQEINKFIGMSGTGLFFVELLETEKRYDDIFKQINTGYTIWLSQKDIADMLKVAATYFPHQTLAEVVTQTTLLLDTGQRSRSIYQPIAKWFKALKDIPNLEKQTKTEARQIEAKYNRLNALREELRGVGVL